MHMLNETMPGTPVRRKEPDNEGARTPHELATSEFLCHVSEIAGVRCVQTENGIADGISTVTVHVDSLRSESARRVYDMEALIRRRFRGSNFTVRVRELVPFHAAVN